jgi:hypothetical protein
VLRVALIQGLLPNTEDFNKGLAGLEEPSFRARHRNHTATLLSLASKQLSAYRIGGPLLQKPVVDLVVLPEYSVHVDDQDLLRAFSDETGAMLHYGLLGARNPNDEQFTNASRWLVPVRSAKRRTWLEVDQGKLHLTQEERDMGVSQWCPYRLIIELDLGDGSSYRMAGAVCYDATDLGLASDLKNESHLFIVLALNKDIKTFDSMVSALRYHMYQHIVVCNSGEFGGSTVQAPYDEEHRRTISHVHGANQIAMAVFEIKIEDFGPGLVAGKEETVMGKKRRLGKTPPANLKRRK